MDAPRFPVFILGGPRAGTTAAVAAFRSAGYGGFKEGHVLSLIEPIGRVVDLHYRHQGSQHPKSLINNIEQDTLKADLFAAIRLRVDSLQPDGPWLDRTGGAYMVKAAPVLAELWPSSVFVFMKRRGIEGVRSRLAKFPSRSFAYHCTDWTTTMAAWRSVRDLLEPDRHLECDQHEMLNTPELTAERLQRFLSLSAHSTSRMLRTLHTAHLERTSDARPAGPVSLCTVGWSNEQQQSFLDLCGDEMVAYGYSLSDSYYEPPVISTKVVRSVTS